MDGKRCSRKIRYEQDILQWYDSLTKDHHIQPKIKEMGVAMQS